MAPSTLMQLPQRAPLTCAFSKAPGSSVMLLNTSYSSSIKLQQHDRWGITVSITHFIHSCPHLDRSYLLTLTSMAPVSTLMCSPHPLSLSCTCMHLSLSLCPQESLSASGSWSIPFPFRRFALSLLVIIKEHYWIASSRGTTSAFFADTKKGNLGQNSSDQKCSYGKKKGHKTSECCKLKKEKEEQGAAKASKTASSSSNSSLTTTARIACSTDTQPLSGTICLFRTTAIPCRSPITKRLHTACEHALEAQVASSSKDPSDDWIMDSGASQNMCRHHHPFPYGHRPP